MEKFEYYLDSFIFTEEDVFYENNSIEVLYDMLTSYFIPSVNVNYQCHFSSLLFVLENNLTDVEYLTVAMCYDDFFPLIQKHKDEIVSEKVFLEQLNKRFPTTETDVHKILEICESGIFDKFWD